MILMVNVHESRASDLVVTERITTEPAVPQAVYLDQFGNWCRRIVAPPGRITISGSGIIRDSGHLDPYVPEARQHAVQDLPADTLMYLLGSRYCETDSLSQLAWQLFGNTPPGWARVQAICDYFQQQITFNYLTARPTRTANDALRECTGVCRDFAHLVITFCRCLNIPARYCTGYLSDIGLPPPYAMMDFAAWIEVYLDGAWRTFDPRNNERRRGRILMARGRDASDVAIATTFGPAWLEGFRVVTNELPAPGANLLPYE